MLYRHIFTNTHPIISAVPVVSTGYLYFFLYRISIIYFIDIYLQYIPNHFRLPSVSYVCAFMCILYILYTHTQSFPPSQSFPIRATSNFSPVRQREAVGTHIQFFFFGWLGGPLPFGGY